VTDRYQFHASILREYHSREKDVRGIVGETLSEIDARYLGQAFISLGGS
jgi:hypothetical protein